MKWRYVDLCAVVFGSIVAGTAVVSIVITALLLLLIIRCRSPTHFSFLFFVYCSQYSVHYYASCAHNRRRKASAWCLSVCLSVRILCPSSGATTVSVDQEKFTHVNSNRNSLFEHLSGLRSSIIVANAILILLSMQFLVSKLLTK